MTRILGVHGVGNFQPRRTPDQAATRLGDAWTQALRRGVGASLEPLDLRVAYYAPHLNTVTGQSAADPELLPDTAAAMVLAWAEALGAPPHLAQGYGTAPIRQIADWVARRFGLDLRLVRAFIAVFFREVATYLQDRDSPARVQARDTVADAIRIHRPDILITHSLGSVVAYEALWAHQDPGADLMITIGSPLGMPDVVFERLLPRPSGTGRRPPRIRQWVNVADVGGLVAIPKRLAERFEVDSEHEEAIHLFDFHKASNYLACRTVAMTIADHHRHRGGAES